MAQRRATITSLVGLPDDQKLTINDVAAIIDKHYATAYSLVVGGDIEHIRIGRSISVEVRALRAFIDSRRRGGSPSQHQHGSLKKAI